MHVYSIAFTPSGQQLISGSYDKKIIIWQLQAISGQKPDITKDPSADLFQKQQEFAAPDKVKAISISPDGNTVASGGDDNDITLWELNSGKKLKTLSQHREPISERGLAFSPDGHYLASGSYDDTAIIWQLDTGKPVQVLTGHTGDVNKVSFSAGGKSLATASEDKTLRLWEVATGKPQRVFNGHQNTVWTVSWFGDYLVSGSDDRTIRLWDSSSGVSLRVLQGHESGVQDLALHGGSLWSASNDGTARRWPLSLPFQQAWQLPSEPASTVITPDLTHVAIGFANGTLALYDGKKPDPVWHKTAVHSKDIQRMSVSRDGSLLASGSFDNTAKLWQIHNTEKGISLEETQTLAGHKDAIHALAFSPDAKTLATASYDSRIGLFDLDKSKPARFINPAHQGHVNSVEFDNSGKQLVSSGFEDRSLKLWNLQNTPPTSLNFPIANDSLLWASISPDNQKLVSVGRDQSVDVYDSQSTQPLYHLTGHESTVYRAIFASDSQQVATVSNDGTVKVWGLEQAKELFSLDLPTEFMLPSAVWDFDFRCLKAKCLIAVPLVRGQLQLYQLAYEGKLTEDADENKRQQLNLWRLYLNSADQLLQTHALQPALQTLHETAEIADRYLAQFPNDPDVEVLKQEGDCQQLKVQQLLKAENKPLNIDSEIKLSQISSAKVFGCNGISLYKQKNYAEAQTVFSQGLEKFPSDLPLLSNDAELALVQGDIQRMQQRLNTLQALYRQQDGVYSDQYPAIMQFLQYLSDQQQTPESVLKVIAQTDKAVRYGWDFADIQPVLKQLSPAKQKTADLLIAFFENRLDLPTLTTKLAALEKKSGKP